MHLYWIREKLDRCMQGCVRQHRAQTMRRDLPQTGRIACRTWTGWTGSRRPLPATTPLHDKANRVGELKARVNVLRNLHKSRVLPSIPDGGFTSEPAPSSLIAAARRCSLGQRPARV